MRCVQAWIATHPVPKANIVASNDAVLNSRQVFAMDTLHRLGVPETQKNADVLLSQFQAEEPPGTSAAYNPGNIEVATARSFGYNDVGSWDIAPQIATFKTWNEGVRAYATALQRIAPSVIVDLKNQADPTKTISDLGASGWGTGTSAMESIYASGAELGSARLGDVSGGASGGRNTLTPPPSTGGDSIIPSIPGLPSPLQGIGSLFSGIAGATGGVESFILRGGKVLIGIVLIVTVIFLAMKGSIPGPIGAAVNG
jgi:hypothetical protein